MKRRSTNTEREHYAQAQQEFIRERDEIFSATEPLSEKRPWRLTSLIGVTNAERRIWKKIYKIVLVVSVVVVVYLIWSAISIGMDFWDAIGRLALGLSIGGVTAKWKFRYIIRMDYDRYPQGRDFEHASISQSECAGLASLGVPVKDWRHPASSWTPDAPNDRVSLFTTIIFAASLCFLIVGSITAWVISMMQTGATT